MPVYPQTNPEKISLYAEALTELRMRLRSVPDIAASDLPDRIKVESCYLQLRLATECFAIGMLAAQGDFKTFKKLTSSYSTVDIFKALAKAYPHFFPILSIAKRLGATRPFDLLDTEQILVHANNQLAASEVKLADRTALLFKALGGGWQPSPSS